MLQREEERATSAEGSDRHRIYGDAQAGSGQRGAVAVLEVVVRRRKRQLNTQAVFARIIEALLPFAERIPADRLVVRVVGGVVLDFFGDDVAGRRDLDFNRPTLVPEDERVARKDKEEDLEAGRRERQRGQSGRLRARAARLTLETPLRAMNVDAKTMTLQGKAAA